MSSNPPITNWLVEFRAGDDLAAEKIWKHYLHQLLRVASARMGDLPRKAYDEEDAALSAFNLFTNRARRDYFPQLNNRDDLWRLLVLITCQKVTAWRRRESAAKRGGAVRLAEMPELICEEPTAEVAVQTAEEYERLLALLDSKQQQTAALKLHGYTNNEIARELGVVERTVERKLMGIRRVWQRELEQET